MSQENVEGFNRVVDAMNRRDIEGVLQELDPAVEWHMALQESVGGVAAVYRGHEGVWEYFRDMDEVFAELELHYTEIRDLGDRVLAIGSFRARGRLSGAVIDSPVAALVEVNNDSSKATKVLTYFDPDEALEA